MNKFSQAERLLRIKTSFEDDFFLINGLTATEGISELFKLEVELLHEESAAWPECDPIDPKRILGQPVSILITQGDHGQRYFNGIVSRFSQGPRSRRTSQYSITVVPEVWEYTQRRQNRIFQQKTVQSIIEEVLAELENPIKFELEHDYKPRNYCVQYRETDFDFISRLMEEEGIYYFFEHTEDGAHKMIISDAPRFTLDCPLVSELKFLQGNKEEVHETFIAEWGTDYQLGPGVISFRDHHIQQPNKTLEKTHPTKFEIGDNGKWEIYDHPGGYARKYDGISPQGTEQASDLGNVDPDGQRTAETAMQVIDAQYMTGAGHSNCSSLTSGHRFKVKDHPQKQVNGQYVLTSITHRATQHPSYQEDETGHEVPQPYQNWFRALSHGRPEAVPFRPVQKTLKPIIHGSQTAVVVGTGDEEIFTDKYGRVKVRFFWDREGKADGLDSCWLPVAQAWAGNGWGSMFIPRVGMEVIVHFLEGDPDRPIVSGCVYHPMNMPPYALPENKTRSGIKSDSSKGGGGFNEFRIEDKKGSEQIFMHGEKDLDVRIKNDVREWTGNDEHLIVKNDRREKIENDTHLIVENDQIEHIKRDRHLKVGTGMMSKEAKEVTGSQTLKVGSDQGITIGGSKSEEVTGAMYLKGMNVVIEGMAQLSLKVGGSFVDINPGGVFITGPMVMLNSGGAAGSGVAVPTVAPTAPQDPDEADNDKPGSKMKLEKQSAERKKNKPSKEDPKKKSWIKLKMVDEEGKPVPGEAYRIKTSDGKIRTGSLNHRGEAEVKGIEPGNCEVTFPNLDKDAWEDA